MTVTLASERARQARMDATPPVRRMPPRKKAAVTAGTVASSDADVAWMHDEFDTMIDRMFGRQTTP